MDRDWLDRLAHDLSATRAELLGLALLVVGGIVLTVLVVGRVEGSAVGDGPVAGTGAGTEVVDGGSDGPSTEGSSEDASSEDASSEDGSVGTGSVDGTGASGSGPGAGDGAAPVGPGGSGSAASGVAGPSEGVGAGSVVVVHVTGAVAAPGVLELPAGSRLVDAVEAAGGTTGDAATDVLNLAAQLRDGQRLHVPTAAEAAAATAEPSEDGSAVDGSAGGGSDGDGSGGGGSHGGGGPGLDPTTGRPPTPAPEPGRGGVPADGDAAGPSAPVDLNRAGTTELETLPGVGPVLAGRIVAWREEHGPFTSVGQLRDVSGIGEKTFQTLAPLVVVS